MIFPQLIKILCIVTVILQLLTIIQYNITYTIVFIAKLKMKVLISPEVL